MTDQVDPVTHSVQHAANLHGQLLVSECCSVYGYRCPGEGRLWMVCTGTCHSVELF